MKALMTQAAASGVGKSVLACSPAAISDFAVEKILVREFSKWTPYSGTDRQRLEAALCP